MRGGLLQFPRTGMGELFVRAGIVLLLTFACPAVAPAGEHDRESEQDLPTAEMLEFLGDLDPVDDETWSLLEHHARQDLAQNQEVKDE